MSNPWNSGSADILQAITEHPDYPIYFMVDDTEAVGDFVYTIREEHKVKVAKITIWDDVIFDDENKFDDYVKYSIWDDGLSEGENERAIDRIIESQRWEPCILVYTGA